MNRSLPLLLAFLGFVLLLYYLVILLVGFNPNPLARILAPLLLAGLAWLFGAALVWSIRKLPTRIVLLFGSLVLAALALVRPVFFEHEPWGRPASFDLALIGFVLPQLLPCLALIASALLLATGIRPRPERTSSQSTDWEASPEETGRSTRLAAVALGGTILIAGLYHLYWLFLWDSTYDALNVIYLFLPVLAVLFAAALLGSLQSGKRQWLSLVYAGLVMPLVLGTYLMAKSVDFRSLTEARAERIAQALEAYRARRGSYPQSLRQLTPGTMLFIPEPVILHGQSWCYQGESDAYRLAYVDREHWSSPELFGTISQRRGSVSSGGEACAAEIAQMAAAYPDFYGMAR